MAKSTANPTDSDMLRFRNPVMAAGFTQMSNLVLRCGRIPRPLRLLYADILSYAWDKDNAFPGQETLAEDMGVTPRQIRSDITALEATGLLSVERRGNQQTNVYWVEDIPAWIIEVASERKSTSAHSDRKPTSGSARKHTSAPDRKPTSAEEDTVEKDSKENVCVADPPVSNNPPPRDTHTGAGQRKETIPATEKPDPPSLIGLEWEPDPTLAAHPKVASYRGNLAFQVSRFRGLNATKPLREAPGLFLAFMALADPAKEPKAAPAAVIPTYTNAATAGTERRPTPARGAMYANRPS